MAGSEGNAPLFGLNIDPSVKNHDLAFALARLADETDLDMICVQDHPYNSAFFDTWTLLTALGMATQEVRLLPNVLNLPLRPPAMVAKAAATLDILTGGRVELGLGAGAFREGVVGYGGPERTPGEAVSALEEALHILRLLWEEGTPGQTASFQGRFYQLHNAQVGPVPAHDMHIWLGGLKPRMLRLTGRLADGLLVSSTYLPPEEMSAVQQIIDEAAQQAGRAPTAIRRGYNLMGIIHAPGSRMATARSKGVIAGTPKHWIEELVRYYHDLRLDTFIVWPLMGDEQRQARTFAEEIVPAVKEAINKP